MRRASEMDWIGRLVFAVSAALEANRSNLPAAYGAQLISVDGLQNIGIDVCSIN